VPFELQLIGNLFVYLSDVWYRLFSLAYFD